MGFFLQRCTTCAYTTHQIKITIETKQLFKKCYKLYAFLNQRTIA